MDSLTFYFDRCFGTRFPDAIRRAKPPFTIEYQHDRKSQHRFRQAMPDDEWLAIAGKNRWIVFSHDRKFHHVEAERFAIKQYGVGCFYLWGNNAQTWEKLRSFMRAYDRIIKAIQDTQRPFIYDVGQSGRLRRVEIP